MRRRRLLLKLGVVAKLAALVHIPIVGAKGAELQEIRKRMQKAEKNQAPC